MLDPFAYDAYLPISIQMWGVHSSMLSEWGKYGYIDFKTRKFITIRQQFEQYKKDHPYIQMVSCFFMKYKNIKLTENHTFVYDFIHNLSDRKPKVFLGGTYTSNWRDKLIPLLKNVDYYNPVVEDWNEERQKEEILEREQNCQYCLYVITPRMTGVYSIAEAVEDSCKRPDKTIFVVMDFIEKIEANKFVWFDKQQLKSLRATVDLILRNKAKGSFIFKRISELADFLNSLSKKTL